MDSSSLFCDPLAVYEQVVEFLGLPREPPRQFGNRFPGRYRIRMQDATRRELLDYFRPFNARLYEMLGRNFDWDDADTASAQERAA